MALSVLSAVRAGPCLNAPFCLVRAATFSPTSGFKMTRAALTISLLGLAFASVSCQNLNPGDEPGPNRTLVYYLKVEASLPDVSIETNKVFAGKTPLVLRLFGDPPGTFRDFGSPEFSLQAVPPSTNYFLQNKVFRTGKGSTPGDRIPGMVFFDMSQPSGATLIDSFPDK
jgi:hypothetical protein